MEYVAGVDLGTAYSAAAVYGPDGLSTIDLDTRATVMPSVVAVRDDGEILTGTNAERRLVIDPSSVAREFKRRLGDSTPMLLGGTPYGTADLTAYLLRSIIDVVTERQGGPPAIVGLSHPANYGGFKLDLLKNAARQAGIEETTFVEEPVAAAVHYSQTERVAVDDVIAVYDLGGGTFDASVVRRTADGFEVIGKPDGMDRFGGIDMDEAVLGHVRAALGDDLAGIDGRDPAVMAALNRLREECQRAKEALSGDSQVEIPVMIPNVHTEVRLVRTEFEDMIRPRIRETIGVLERTISSAGVDIDDVSRVLLVGGSSRIPLVGEMISQATGKPVSLDAHPKLTVALGTARVAYAAIEPQAGPPPTVVDPGSTVQPAAGGAATIASGAALPQSSDPEATQPVQVESTQPLPTEPLPTQAEPTQPLPVQPPNGGGTPEEASERGSRRWMAVAGVAVVAVVAVIAAVVVTSGSDPEPEPAATEVASSETPAEPEVTEAPVETDSANTEPPIESTTVATAASTTVVVPQTAEQELALLIERDIPAVNAIVETWVPQLSAKMFGLEVDGILYGYPEILDDHLQRRTFYEAVLVDGATYNFNSGGEPMAGWYITIVPLGFASADGALAWCLDQNIDRENCFAKFVSTDDDIGNTRVLNP